jgi:hypothetical protein
MAANFVVPCYNYVLQQFCKVCRIVRYITGEIPTLASMRILRYRMYADWATRRLHKMLPIPRWVGSVHSVQHASLLHFRFGDF